LNEKYPRKIQEQNAIAISVLNHLLSDHFLKAVIHKFGLELAKNILEPLILRAREAEGRGEETAISCDFLINPKGC
jgi:hypothetical protein